MCINFQPHLSCSSHDSKLGQLFVKPRGGRLRGCRRFSCGLPAVVPQLAVGTLLCLSTTAILLPQRPLSCWGRAQVDDTPWCHGVKGVMAGASMGG